MHKKRHFLSYQKCHHDAKIMCKCAHYTTLGSHCKMASSSSEDEADTWPESITIRYKDTAVSVGACQGGF